MTKPKRPFMKGWHEDHEDVGSLVESTLDVTFASGQVVKAGAKGKVIRVEPAITKNGYIVRIARIGDRCFDKDQLKFVCGRTTRRADP